MILNPSVPILILPMACLRAVTVWRPPLSLSTGPVPAETGVTSVIPMVVQCRPAPTWLSQPFSSARLLLGLGWQLSLKMPLLRVTPFPIGGNQIMAIQTPKTLLGDCLQPPTQPAALSASWEGPAYDQVQAVSAQTG